MAVASLSRSTRTNFYGCIERARDIAVRYFNLHGEPDNLALAFLIQSSVADTLCPDWRTKPITAWLQYHILRESLAIVIQWRVQELRRKIMQQSSEHQIL